MNPRLVTREEAVRRRLPGSQYVRDGHQIYLDKQSAIGRAMELLRQARLSFFDAYCIKHAKELQANVEADSRRARHLAYNRTRHQALDDFKIGTAIELSLRAKLIGAGYVVHRIDPESSATKTLASDQEESPILISELLKHVGFVFDVESQKPCYLPGLKPKSLPFDWLLDSKRYRIVIGLKERDLQIAKVFRDRRNMIHLPIGEHDKAEEHFGARPSFKDVFGFVDRHIDKYADDLATLIEDDNWRRLLRAHVTEKLIEPD